ncbi:N-acetyltransferase family protein [Paenibacillus ferrarius]|uniref:GNAT family N-acetyltransferase n=1 Tax=Paenibacillus ferrarius TaxID=1469647 RepID=UPI003D298A7F
MTNSLEFVDMEERHLPSVQAIYNYYVANTTISFHTQAQTLEEMRKNVINSNPRYRTYVIKRGETVIGYALFTKHKDKQAYDTTAEVTIYMDPNHIGQKIGPEVLAFLEGKALELGFHALVATVCTENERSIRMFERSGYVRCALFKEIGFKFDRWLDIASYQKILGNARQ